MFNNDNQVAVVLNYSDLCEICDFYDVSPGEISDNPCYPDTLRIITQIFKT